MGQGRQLFVSFQASQSGVIEIITFLGYCGLSLGACCPPFQDHVVASSLGVRCPLKTYYYAVLKCTTGTQ